MEDTYTKGNELVRGLKRQAQSNPMLFHVLNDCENCGMSICGYCKKHKQDAIKQYGREALGNPVE